jgi:hypothetical protein
MSPIPERSPFQAGDRVQVHGYAGYPPGHRRYGFVGTVEQYWGRGQLLGGTTDTGEQWCESWAALVREGEPAKDRRTVCCTCCPCEHYHPTFWGPGAQRLSGTTSAAPPTEAKPSHVDRKQAA